jgi:hypothetical protein
MSAFNVYKEPPSDLAPEEKKVEGQPQMPHTLFESGATWDEALPMFKGG